MTEVGRRRLVDPSTGEVHTVAVIRRRLRYFKDDYAVVFLNRLGNLAENRSLGWQELRVLLGIMRDIEFGNEWRGVSQTALAERLGMQRQNVSAAVKVLARKGIIYKSLSSVGKTEFYRVSPHLVWKGKGKDHMAACVTAPPIKSDPDTAVAKQLERSKAQRSRPLIPDSHNDQSGE